MKVSIITVCYNTADTIEDTLKSVASQTHDDIEHIVVDGASSDATCKIISNYADSVAKWVSEPDNGIYDAMNKGIGLATGDVVGFLNADDVFNDSDVVAQIAEAFQEKDVQAVYGDVVFVREDMSTVVRYYRSSRFSAERIPWGWMPPHPSVYMRSDLFDKFGMFKTDYRIAADFEMVARMFWVHRVQGKYLPLVVVKMRVGGVSTRNLKSNYVLSTEVVRACRENGIRTSLSRVLLKYPAKLLEMFVRPG